MKKELTQKEEIQKEIQKHASIEALSKTEGGQLVIKTLEKDILYAINSINVEFKSATHAELISLCAKLSEKTTMYRLLIGAEKRKGIAIEDLQNFLKENGDE